MRQGVALSCLLEKRSGLAARTPNGSGNVSQANFPALRSKRALEPEAMQAYSAHFLARSGSRAVFFSVALLLAAAACGDDDDDSEAEDADDVAVGRDGGQANFGNSPASRDDSGPGDASAIAPAPCDVEAARGCSAEPEYAEVAAIIEARCVGCHNGRGEEWALISQAHVAAWYNEIRAAMLSCAMPPPASGITMPTEERELILQWIRCNF